MAEYKVPQDVEADDKLLGPLTFRQFIYMMIVLGLTALAVALFQIFPLLAVIPVPFILFFLILALPIKKDQPMETYLAALVSFYFKPKKRFWMPGQSESTILITAPKRTEPNRVRNITREEAGHRLSFLSALVDSEGYAIKTANSPLRDEFFAEAYNTTDMFDHTNDSRIGYMINQEQEARHAEIVNQMRSAIANSDYNPERNLQSRVALNNQHTIQPRPTAIPQSQAIVQPTLPSSSADQLAFAPDLSVQTIQQTADQLAKSNQNKTDEVYVALH